MQKPWITVAVFEDASAARALEEFFRKKAVGAKTCSDHALQVLLFISPPHLTHRVEVRGNFYRFAQEVLEKNPPDILESAIHCPNCGSLQVFYPKLTRKSVQSTLQMHMGLIFRNIEHQCYCEKCQYTWSLPRSTASEVNTVKPAH